MASRQSHLFRSCPRGAILLSLVLVVAAAAGLQAQQAPVKTPAEEPAAKQKEQAASLDRYGDVLPPGAKARLGMLWLQSDRGAHRACFGLTPDGKTIVTFSHSRWLKWWDAGTGKLREQRELPVTHLFDPCLSFDGRLLAAQERGTYNLDVWDVRTGKRVQRLERPKQSAIYWKRFSPDGKTLAAQGSRNVIFLWDIASGKRRSLQGGAFAFSPDGKRLASTLDQRVICWDTKTGEAIWQTAAQFIAPGWVSLAFTPNGRVLIVAPHHHEDAWHAYDAATGNAAEGLKLPDKHQANDLAVAPDGRTLVFVHYRGVYVAPPGFRHIRLWDLREGKLLHALPATGDIGPFFPDGKSFLSNDGALQRWELATGRPLFAESYKLGHQVRVFQVIYSPDGRRLASGDFDGAIRLWDVAGAKTLHILPGHRRYYFSMAFTPDGKFLVTGAIEDKVYIWDVETGKLVRRIPLRGPEDKDKDVHVRRLQVTADGRSLLVLEYNPQRQPAVLSRWNLATGERKTRDEFNADLTASVFSRDGQMLAAGLELLDAATLKSRVQLEENSVTKSGGCYAFSADGRMAAGLITRRTKEDDPATRTTTVIGLQIWETATGKTRRCISLDNMRQFRFANITFNGNVPLALSPDGRHLAVADAQGLWVWELASGKVLLQRPIPALMREKAVGNPFASCLCFAPDGRSLATGNVDSTILIWNLP